MGQQAIFGAGLLLWMAVGCGKSVTQPNLDEPFQLRPGQTVTVVGPALEVTFERVEQDSRCPSDVTCVWEGDATVRVVLSQPSRPPQSFQIHTAGSLGRTVTYLGHQVELRELQPQPRSTAEIPKDQYRLTLAVRRAGAS
ncbi:MAG TPA: hypothetical protein VF310_00930 [Vicinamibacteria bacterium]|jgi:hypothetical protein